MTNIDAFMSATNAGRNRMLREESRATTYIVHYRLDDRAGTPGRCRTDYHLDKGETFYAGPGRAVVRSCIADVAVDATFTGKNARLLHSLSLGEKN